MFIPCGFNYKYHFPYNKYGHYMTNDIVISKDKEMIRELYKRARLSSHAEESFENVL